MSFSLDTVKAAVLKEINDGARQVLDIGSGDGKLLDAVRQKLPEVDLFACDYTDSFLKIDNCNLSVINVDTQELPYNDNSFDIVTITEVIEHLENYHRVLREIYRVLKPGGKVIITTPNILNLKSRVNFLKFGFWNLFGPLPLNSKTLEDTSGHITPVHYYHLVYSLTHSSFIRITLNCDKTQNTSLFYYIFLYPLLKIWTLSFIRKEKNKYGSVDEKNLSYAKAINSFHCLTARSILVTAKKAK